LPAEGGICERRSIEGPRKVDKVKELLQGEKSREVKQKGFHESSSGGDEGKERTVEKGRRKIEKKERGVRSWSDWFVNKLAEGLRKRTPKELIF